MLFTFSFRVFYNYVCLFWFLCLIASASELYLSLVLLIAVFWQRSFFLIFLVGPIMLCWELNILCRTLETEINSFNTWKWVSLSVFIRPLVGGLVSPGRSWTGFEVCCCCGHSQCTTDVKLRWSTLSRVQSWGWFAEWLFSVSGSLSALGLPFTRCLWVVCLHALSALPEAVHYYLFLDTR